MAGLCMVMRTELREYSGRSCVCERQGYFHELQLPEKRNGVPTLCSLEALCSCWFVLLDEQSTMIGLMSVCLHVVSVI